MTFSVLMVLVGCETETTAPEHHQGDQGEFDNPYDWVGEMHNKGLDHALSRIAADPSADWGPDAVKTVVMEFVQSEPGGPHLLAAGVSDVDFRDLAAIGLWTVDAYHGYISTLYTEGKVSHEFADYATLILDLCLQGSAERLNHIAGGIHNSAMPQGEKVILLSAVAVAKHSTEYWSTRPATEVLRGTQALPPIAAADLVGGVCGGVTTWVTTRGTGHSDWMDIAGGALIGAVGASTLGFLKVG
jgi:hypothetical protein